MPNEHGPEPVSREVVLDARLPRAVLNERIAVRRIRIAAKHPAGLHTHNGPVLGSIVAGSAWYQVEGEPATELTPGDVFYEPSDARIARFGAGPMASNSWRTFRSR